MPCAYVIAPMVVGVALVLIQMVAQARIPKQGRCMSPSARQGYSWEGQADRNCRAPMSSLRWRRAWPCWWSRWSPKQEFRSEADVCPECLPGLFLERPSGQELWGAYVITPMEVGVALVVNMVAQTRVSEAKPMSDPECLPRLLLGGPGK